MINALILALALSAYPSARQQMRLEQGMTMEQVLLTLGEPDSVEQTTCGKLKPWSCRIWHYSGDYKFLLVFFGRDDAGTWSVESWSG